MGSPGHTNMIELIINNSYSQIKNLNTLEFNQLRAILSYDISKSQSYYSGNYFNTKKYLIDAKGNFPTGLINRVHSFLNNKSATVIEKRSPLKSTEIGLESINEIRLGVSPYNEQLEAVKACIERDRGTLSMVTGSGKSLTMALLVNQLKVKTLIIVPTLELKKQLKDSFREWFGNTNHITIKNIDDKSLFKDTDYDCLIIDEAHHVAAKTYRELNKKAWNGIFHRYFFTATPFRSNNEEQILFESIAGEVIYELPYKTAVENGYIVPVEAYYIELPKQDIFKDNSGRTWREVYNKLVVENVGRNTIIRLLLVRLNATKCPTLCLVKEIKHGENILEGNSDIPWVNGQDDESREQIEKFNNGHISTIVGTTGLIGEGIDTRPAEVIIIAGLGKSKNQFMQNVGRGIRRGFAEYLHPVKTSSRTQ